MELSKLLNKIFLEALEEPMDDDAAEEIDPNAAVDNSPELADDTPDVATDVPTDVPTAASEVPRGGEVRPSRGVGPVKRERVNTEAGLKRWYGIPEAAPGKTLDDLKSLDWKNGITPAKAGWTFEEVLAAMKPSILDKANYYSKNNQYLSQDEAVLAGMSGVNEAWKNDKGKSAFPSYAFRYIDSAMSRESAHNVQMITGEPMTKGGTLDWRGLRGTMTHSADVEDASGDPISANIAAQETERDTKRARSNAMIQKFIDNPNVGLSATEKLVLAVQSGLRKDSQGNMIPPAKLAQAVALQTAMSRGVESGQPTVSAARVSQIRASALAKIQAYLADKGITSLDSAERKLGMDEAVIGNLLITIIRESIDLEISRLQKFHKVPMDAVIEGKEIGINVIVDATTIDVVDAVDRFDDSILAKVPSRILQEAKEMTLYSLSDEYYTEIMESIIDAHSKDIIADSI